MPRMEAGGARCFPSRPHQQSFLLAMTAVTLVLLLSRSAAAASLRGEAQVAPGGRKLKHAGDGGRSDAGGAAAGEPRPDAGITAVAEPRGIVRTLHQAAPGLSAGASADGVTVVEASGGGGVPVVEPDIDRDVVLGDDCADGGDCGAAPPPSSGGGPIYGPIFGNVTVGGDDAKEPTGPLRLYVVTQWAPTVGREKAAELTALELSRARECSATLSAGWAGRNTNEWVSNMWGSHGRVLDFADAAAYVAYRECEEFSDATFEMEGYVAGQRSALIQITEEEKAQGLGGSEYVHLSLLSTQPAREVTLLAYSMDLAAAVSGAAYSLGSGVAHRRYVASLFPGTDSAAVAQHVAFKEPQGALGYFFFREGRGTVPAHPLYQSLRSMLTAIPAEVEFRPTAI